MQYWHFGTKQFVTWQTFDLTDGQPLFLDFSNDLGQNPYSEMWRIVLVNASAIINQADSLAASTRIDSLQSQRYEPSLEMTIKVPTIRVHFMADPPVRSAFLPSPRKNTHLLFSRTNSRRRNSNPFSPDVNTTC